jgi:hypothetical protein
MPPRPAAQNREHKLSETGAANDWYGLALIREDELLHLNPRSEQPQGPSAERLHRQGERPIEPPVLCLSSRAESDPVADERGYVCDKAG